MGYSFEIDTRSIDTRSKFIIHKIFRLGTELYLHYLYLYIFILRVSVIYYGSLKFVIICEFIKILKSTINETIERSELNSFIIQWRYCVFSSTLMEVEQFIVENKINYQNYSSEKTERHFIWNWQIVFLMCIIAFENFISFMTLCEKHNFKMHFILA